MKIKKALITTAGFGTRVLPITKTIQKEMLPILNRPLVDYVVEDCIKAGMEEIVFVISEHNIQVKHFYSENKRLHQYLQRMGKVNKYQQVAHLHSQAKFTFVVQKDDEQYGTATPVALAEEYLRDEEAFLVFMGDDFIFNSSGQSEAEAMITTFKKANASGLTTCIEKPEALLHKYGIAKTRTANGYLFLKELIEKPTLGTAPSNLANISKYIFTPKIFDIIRNQPVNKQTGELYITDSISILAQHADVVIHTPRGEYLDGGYIEGWLKANLTVALSQPELKQVVSEFIKDHNLT